MDNQPLLDNQGDVMIVDDTPDNLRLLIGMLSREGYKVRPVPNGKLALAAVASAAPELILLDIDMPDLNGYEVCQRLKADEATRDIPVIFLSAMHKTVDKIKAFAVGGVDYITKPFQMEEVLVRLKTHLSLSRLNKHLEELVEKRTNDVLRLNAEKEQIEAEMQIARQMQESFLPRCFPPFPDHQEIDIYAMMEPAKAVGGDFYDFFFIDDHRLFFTIGDVSGKGSGAALFMVRVMTLLEDKATHSISPEVIMFQVNNALLRKNPNCMFATVYLGILDLQTGEITYASGGHNPPLVTQQHNFEYLHLTSGMVIGAFPLAEETFQRQKIILEPEDTIFLYSDGVTEAINQNDELYAEQRLQARLNQLRDHSVQEMVEGLDRSLKQFAGDREQADDITMLAIRFHGKV